MDRKKLIYIGLILILTVIVSITYFSYAFFTHRDEQSGKLNIVTGTLNYKIESNDLVNNSITLEAKQSKQIEIEITSLNSISSKYELYYTTTASNVVIGYSSNDDTPTGTIAANSKKTVKIVIKNKADSSATITFGVEGGFNNNELVLSTGSHITDIIDNICNYETGYVWNFPFDPDGDEQGQVQPFEVPCDGNYKLEVWGASGGYGFDSTRSTGGGGYGGYSVGNIALDMQEYLYIAVGGAGKSNCQTTSCSGGYNGGSSSSKWANGTGSGLYTGGGGGSTHIALNNNLGELKNYLSSSSDILIVAGGGGGADYYPSWSGNSSGGSGGGISGTGSTSGANATQLKTNGGTQNTGYLFGTAGTTYTSDSTGGSGGGWYGGTSSFQHMTGAGGSGYIRHSLLTDKHMYCYDCATSTVSETYTISNGTSSCHNSVAAGDCAKEGNGYARITYLGE